MSPIFDRVAVLGAGSWGTTVASLLAPRIPVILWARSADIATEIRTHRTNRRYTGAYAIPDSLGVTSELAEALSAADLVVVAVPSKGFRDVLDAGSPYVGADSVVLSLTKGLEHGSLARMTEIVAESWSGRLAGVLTGPNIASEVRAGQPAASVVALGDDRVARAIQALLSSESLRVYRNSDVVGCEVAGAVKNVLAVASGMASGLGLGDNARAALITRSLAELTRLGAALGGDPPTFAGLAGLGDLVATCTSWHSRNFAVGEALGRGLSLDRAIAGVDGIAEGVLACRPVVELASRVGVEVPVAEQVVAVCHDGRSPSSTITRLMLRSGKSERDGENRARTAALDG